ncbi:hypothetical protein DFH06DRAFT_1342398 [Mycena polygramma]|nr:hypothetical protein DFH06DRAFT_1342398 [Mycena polygramma]
MPIRNEFEEYALYMLEDNLASLFYMLNLFSLNSKASPSLVILVITAVASASITPNAFFWTWSLGTCSGRTMDPICSIPIDVMFGRDKYPLASLQSTVPRAFEYLRRCYFNKTRARYQERLAGISDRQALMNVYQNWTLHKFGRQAMNLIERRLEILTPRHLNPVLVEDTPRFPEISSMLISRRPSEPCATCATLGRLCNFDCWSNACRECDLTMATGCTFTIFGEWEDFIKKADRETNERLVHFPDYGAQVALERFQELYPLVHEYFIASCIISPYKTFSAFRNVFDALDTTIANELARTQFAKIMPVEFRDILYHRVRYHNSRSEEFDRISIAPEDVYVRGESRLDDSDDEDYIPPLVHSTSLLPSGSVDLSELSIPTYQSAVPVRFTQ